MSRGRWVLAPCVAVGALLEPAPAEACGGFFAPQGVPAAVAGHHMVVSVAPGRTVLWDQIRYTGDPAEFAWVLPVKQGARVEVSRAAFFETLDALSGVRVLPPAVDCGGSSFGCNTTFSLGALDEGAGEGEPEPVEIVHQGTVGPYETVTLSSSVPGALGEWLLSHGYGIDASAAAVIDAYAAEGFDFIALRLLPGQGVAQMTPVRVIGGGDVLPLRMVSVGAPEETPIVLSIIGEGRYRVEGLQEVALQRGLLSWDFADGTTSYEPLRRAALAQNGGASFLTTSASIGFFRRDPFFVLYADRAVQNGESERCSAVFPDEGGLVQDPCPPGEPWDSPACGVVADGVDARRLGCEDLDDVAVALEGLHFDDVWLTRLEMVLPRSALVADLKLVASPSQTPVESSITASIAERAESACPAGTTPIARDDVDRPWPELLFGWGLCGLASLALRRRAQRRAASRIAC